MVDKNTNFDRKNGPWDMTLRDLLTMYKEQKAELKNCREQLAECLASGDEDADRDAAHHEDDVADAERELETTEYDLNHFYEIDDADFALEQMEKNA